MAAVDTSLNIVQVSGRGSCGHQPQDCSGQWAWQLWTPASRLFRSDIKCAPRTVFCGSGPGLIRIGFFGSLDHLIDKKSWSLIRNTEFTSKYKCHIDSVADPGCLSRIPIVSIPDPRSEFLPSQVPDTHQSIFTPPKNCF
jgi:hypothetical protein